MERATDSTGALGTGGLSGWECWGKNAGGLKMMSATGVPV